MNNAKHTPGPWFIRNGVQIRSDKDQIAKVWMMRSGEGSANANLIAAAPELLESLKRLLTLYCDLVDSGDCGSWNPIEDDEVVAAIAAIAKATEENHE